MGLEALLAKLEARDVTAVTNTAAWDVTPKSSQIPDCTSITFVTAKNIVAVKKLELHYRDTFDYREIELPREWAEAFACMEDSSRPSNVSESRWRYIKNNLSMLSHYIDDFIQHGWSMTDIFGCHESLPENRYAEMGLFELART